MQKNDFNFSKNKLVRSDWGRDYYTGHTSKLLNLDSKTSNKILDTEYTYFTHKDKKNLTQNFNPEEMQKRFKYSKGSNLKVLTTGTSMNENLLEILPYTFKDTYYIRLNNVKGVSSEDIFKILKRYRKNIIDYKPNIMILCITSDNIRSLKYLTNED